MSAATLTNPSSSASTAGSPFGHIVLVAGLVLGTLDALDGVLFAGVTAGLNPIQVLQWIASGAIGASAFTGGLGAAALGALLHYGISFAVAAVFAAAYAGLQPVRRFPAAVGLLYGAGVWAVMNLLVVPHSAIGPGALTALNVVHGVVGHALFVGLAGALVVRRLARGGR
jgi:hypothetical protein